MKKNRSGADERRDITQHRVFVIRCWSESGRPLPGMRWRFTLEEVGADERHGFAGVDALLRFLKAWFTVE
jgi:hypothetical protein